MDKICWKAPGKISLRTKYVLNSFQKWKGERLLFLFVQKKIFLNHVFSPQVAFTQIWVVFFLVYCGFKPIFFFQRKTHGLKKGCTSLETVSSKGLGYEEFAWQPSDMLRWTPCPIKGMGRTWFLRRNFNPNQIIRFKMSMNYESILG